MYVQSLHLENIKAFDKLDIEFTGTGEHVSPYAGLNVFVGGNSSGKSTLLKCIAMALSGHTQRRGKRWLCCMRGLWRGDCAGKSRMSVSMNADRLRSNGGKTRGPSRYIFARKTA